MKLGEWLFDGGNEKLPAVKLVSLIGGGCGFCAVYRLLGFCIALAAGWAGQIWLPRYGGLFAFAGAVVSMGVGFFVLQRYAQSLPMPAEQPGAWSSKNEFGNEQS